MPDLLTHVLGVYVGLTVLSWRVSGIRPRHVAVAMVGTVVPDLSKLHLLVDSSLVSAVVGGPWYWGGIHRFGPAVVLVGVGAMCFERGRRGTAFGWLVVGVGFHLVLDLTVKRAGGVAPPYLYPLTWWQPPSADLLLSSDPWPWLLTSVLAAVVWVLDRRVRRGSSGVSER